MTDRPFRSRFVARAAGLGVVVALVLCGAAVRAAGPASAPATAPAATLPTSRAALPGLRPATEQAVADFGAKVDAALRRGDGAMLDAHFDAGSLVTAMTRDVNLPPRAYVGFTEGFARNFTFGTDVARSLGRTGSYRFLRVVRPPDAPDEPRALFRLVTPQSFTYHQLVVRQDRSGAAWVVDAYDYRQGELLSQNKRRVALQVATVTGRAADHADFVRQLQAGSRMEEQVNRQRADDALATFEELPENLRGEKWLHLIRLNAAAAVGPQKLGSAIADYGRRFPKDPTLDLVCVNLFARGKQYAAALGAIDRLDAAMGGDPYLDVLRAYLMLAQDKPAEAKAACLKAAAREPGLHGAHDVLLEVALKERDHAETLRLLDLLEKQFRVSYGDLTRHGPRFAEFMKSPEYQRYAKTHPTSRPATAPARR